MEMGLQYDREIQRWCLGGRDLHCGDGLVVQVASCWLPVRVELDNRHGWVLFADGDRVCILPSTRIPARAAARDHR